jgi:hypothetical protein
MRPIELGAPQCIVGERPQKPNSPMLAVHAGSRVAAGETLMNPCGFRLNADLD